MKVTMQADYRKYYTLEDVDRAREVIRVEKNEDSFTAREALEMAVNHWFNYNPGDWLTEVVRAEAETARNCRVNDYYFTENPSGDMDVWVKGIGKTAFGFIECGAYLSDIYAISSEVDLTEHFYVQYYSKK